MVDQARRTTFGTLLHNYREVAGLTQEALAERAGLSARAISDLERGINRAPRTATLGLLAQALQISAAERARLEAAAHRLQIPPPCATPVSGPPDFAGQPPLMGRAIEQALLQAHLAGEGPPVLVLAGEPGIGKSRLLREAATRAAQGGWAVLAGGCQRRHGQEPFAPLLDALEGRIGRQSPAQLRADLQGCAWLVRLLPELADGQIDPLPAWVVSPEQERRLMFRAVARLLANVAGPAGTLLLLDDLQWAGADGLELLASLLRTPTIPVRVVGAYRDTEVTPTHPLMAVLADLAQAGLAKQHALAPLEPDQAAHLLDRLLADTVGVESAARAQVLERAGGVPFFLVSIAVRLRAGETGAVEEVPWSIAQGIRQRVVALPVGTRETLEVAAVVGRQVPPALLGAVAARSEAEIVADLDTAVRGRLLAEEGKGGYRFAHDLIREALEGDLSSAHRALLHQRVAEALETIYATDLDRVSAQIAVHYEQAGREQQAAAAYARAAARAQRLHANAEAIAQYRAALALLEGPEGGMPEGQHPDTLYLWENLGDVLNLVGRCDEAVEAFEHVLTRLPHDNLFASVHMLLKIAMAYTRHEAYDKALHSLERAERLLGPEPGEPIADWWRAWIDIQLEHIWAYYFLDDLPALAARIEQVRSVVQRDGTLLQRGRLLEVEVGLAFRRDRFVISDQTLLAAQDSLAVQREIGDVAAIALAQFGLGFCQLWRGNLDAAEAHIRAALATNEQIGDMGEQARCLAYLTLILRKRGQHEEVARLAEQTLRASIGSEARFYVGMAHANRAWVAFRRGDAVMAVAECEEALASWEQLAFPFRWMVLWPLLSLALAHGDLDRAAGYGRAMLASDQQPLPETLTLAIEQGLAAWESGQRETASACLSHALALAQELSYF